MDNEERLRHRIVTALDALPVPPAKRRFAHGARASSATGGWPLGRLMIAGVAIVVTAFLVAPVVTGDRPASDPARHVFVADFEGGISPGIWSSGGQGTGYSVRALNDAMAITLEADAKGAQDGSVAGALSLSSCVARGDYEVSVDYVLLQWPAANGAELALVETFNGFGTIRRNQFDGREQYGTRSFLQSATQDTTDMSGSLRLVRRGTTVVASHRSGDSAPWIELPIGLESRFDQSFGMWLGSSEATFGRNTVRVAVDNFRLVAAQLICT